MKLPGWKHLHCCLLSCSLAITQAWNIKLLPYAVHMQSSPYAPSLSGILTQKQTGTLLHVTNMCIKLFFLLRAAWWAHSKLPTPWGSKLLLGNIIDWQFCHLSCFSTNGISLHSGGAEMKNLQRSVQAHFLQCTSSTDSSMTDSFAFEIALCRSRMCSHMWACLQARLYWSVNSRNTGWKLW